MVDRRPIVVVGSINMDLVARTPRIPMAGETITGTGFETTPGRKGANQAVAVARLGYPVTIIGLVGEDVFSGALLENLASAGVDVAPVARVSGPSGIAQILVADRGENSIVVVPGANGRVEPEYIYQHERIIRSARAWGAGLHAFAVRGRALSQITRLNSRWNRSERSGKRS